MLWLKRNLLLIVGVVVSLGLMALAVVYLISRINLERQATTQLAEATAEMERLVNTQPSLSDENIAATRAEAVKVEQLVPQLVPLLMPKPVEPLDNIGFKSLLENTISKLQEQADSVGVTVPKRYSFTFAAQRPVLNFPSNSIPKLTVQLEELQTLCDILFRSKIHSLETLRRVRIYAEEGQGADYIEGKMTLTNGSFIVTPYEVVFRAFSGELAQVLDGLQRSPVFFVVKKLTVQTVQIAPPPPPPAPAAEKDGKGTAKKPGKPGATETKPPETTLITVMEEKPLRVSLSLEVVKLNVPPKPAPTAQPAAAVPGAPTAPAAQPGQPVPPAQPAQ